MTAKQLVNLCCACLVAAGLAGCSSASGANTTVGIVGDSITQHSDGSIRSTVKGVHLEIEALPGHTVRAMTPYVESDIMRGPDGPPQSIFINLGTNDVIRRNPHWKSDWDTLVKDTASVPCKVFFTVSTVVDAYGHRPGPTSEDFNRVIESAHDADPSHVHIIDWNAAVHADFALIEPDGVHPTRKGELWIAQHIGSTLRDVCGE
ncbi:MAG: SGNH/GDSL hydrolase family protein [Acidimicrobiales bacterium]|jgi:hypothetical protein